MMVRYLASASALALALAFVQPAAALVPSAAKIGAPSLVETVAIPADYSVAAVQDALNRLGHDAGSVDGAMGAKTATAIREFQSAKGLAQTGRATPALYEQLQAALGAGGQTSAAASTYTQGPSRETVTDIQSELRRAGYDISVTGEYDQATRGAIRDWQQRTGRYGSGEPSDRLLADIRGTVGQRDTFQERDLVQRIQQELNTRGYDVGVPDGALGPKTRTAIRTYQADASMPVTGEPTPTLLSSMQSASIRAGQSHAGSPGSADPGLIRQVQQELNERGYDAGNPDGTAGGRTRRAISDFQARMNMPVTGEPNVELLASLQRSDRAPAAQGNWPNQRQGGQGQIRLAVEQELSSRGYPIGQVDGVIDQQSRAAIRQYQREAGIDVDGRADQQLLAHIQSSTVRPRGNGQTLGGALGRWFNEVPR